MRGVRLFSARPVVTTRTSDEILRHFVPQDDRVGARGILPSFILRLARRSRASRRISENNTIPVIPTEEARETSDRAEGSCIERRAVPNMALCMASPRGGSWRKAPDEGILSLF